jgi:hypothetical protein
MRMFTSAVLASVILIFAISTYADAAAWCAYYDENAGTNCGFYTLQQCQADVSGVGGYCAPNPEGDQRPGRSKQSHY